MYLLRKKLLFLIKLFVPSYFILFFIWIHIIFKYEGVNHNSFVPLPTYIIPIKQRLHACSKMVAVKKLNTDVDLFFNGFKKCIEKYISIPDSQMDSFVYEIGNERKMFLPLSKNYQQEKCIWLTIGIGGSANAEISFKEKYTKCKIFGVEPINFGNFSKIGNVIPYGVGLSNSEISLSVLVDKSKNKYEMKKSKVISLTNLLDNFVESRLVHYLTIDIEGFEYTILSELVGAGKFATNDIIFCQIDAELHRPNHPTAHPSIKNLNQIKFIFDFLNNSSPYIPIFNAPYYEHQKVTFINVVNPECEKAFEISSHFIKN